MDLRLLPLKNSNTSSLRAFTLVEVVVSLVLVGMVLAMIGGVVVMLDNTVGNERIITLPEDTVAEDDLDEYGYPFRWDSDTSSTLPPSSPAYTMAPSRIMDAKAEALWRQVQEIAMQSSAITAINDYVLHDFRPPASGHSNSPYFIGSGGYLTGALQGPLLASQLSNPNEMKTALDNRFGASESNTFVCWSPPAAVDSNSYRAATIFFLASQDRILGMLRVRSFQFDSSLDDPYRYYEVNLARLVWEDTDNSNLETWVLSTAGSNFVEDFSYRFVEDKKYPQRMLVGFNSTQERSVETSGSWPSGNSTQFFVRSAIPGETLSGDGVSREQTSFTSDSWNLRSQVNEWHLLLPDPGLAQCEKRAKILQKTPRTDSNFNATLYNSITRQGRFACVFKVFP